MIGGISLARQSATPASRRHFTASSMAAEPTTYPRVLLLAGNLSTCTYAIIPRKKRHINGRPLAFPAEDTTLQAHVCVVLDSPQALVQAPPFSGAPTACLAMLRTTTQLSPSTVFRQTLALWRVGRHGLSRAVPWLRPLPQAQGALRPRPAKLFQLCPQERAVPGPASGGGRSSYSPAVEPPRAGHKAAIPVRQVMLGLAAQCRFPGTGTWAAKW